MPGSKALDCFAGLVWQPFSKYLFPTQCEASQRSMFICFLTHFVTVGDDMAYCGVRAVFRSPLPAVAVVQTGCRPGMPVSPCPPDARVMGPRGPVSLPAPHQAAL